MFDLGSHRKVASGSLITPTHLQRENAHISRKDNFHPRIAGIHFRWVQGNKQDRRNITAWNGEG
jgi:hypothetical protein